MLFSLVDTCTVIGGFGVCPPNPGQGRSCDFNKLEFFSPPDPTGVTWLRYGAYSSLSVISSSFQLCTAAYSVAYFYC